VHAYFSLNLVIQVIKGGGDHAAKEVHFGAALHPAILRAKEEVIPRCFLCMPCLRHIQKVVEPMFEDIVIDQQNLLDSPATWGKILELIPDANQKVFVRIFLGCALITIRISMYRLRSSNNGTKLTAAENGTFVMICIVLL
jgi:hypothetical protein